MADKVFILGIDGGTVRVIDELIKQDKLPNFKKIKENGSSGILNSCIPPTTDPAWQVLFTGKNPGNVGFYFNATYLGDEEYQKRLVTKVETETIWSILSKNNRTVGVYNIPFTYPAEKVNGFMVSGLFSPGFERLTYPEELKKELGEDYCISIPDFQYLTKEEQIKRSIEEINKKFNTGIKLYKKYKPEFFMMVIAEVDTVQHFFWEGKKINKTIEECYLLLDKYLGEILEAINEETTLFIASDHGFCKAKYDILLNSVMLNKGYIKLKNEEQKTEKFKNKIAKFLDKFGLRKTISRIISKNLGQVFTTGFDKIDWPNTKAFSYGVGGIYINLKGREPKGCVKKEEYEKTLNEVEKELLELIDPETQEKIIKKIYRKNTIYKGKATERMPDLILIPNEKYVFRDYFGTEWKKESVFSGNHEPEGIFLACGKDIKKGHKVNCDLVDITPTALHILNKNIPLDIDGKIVKDIFKTQSKHYKKKTKKQTEKEYKTQKEKNLISNLIKDLKV